jgi:hypothetical protein
MFDAVLKKYQVKGFFTFRPHEILKDKCNAPTNQSGVYLIYQVFPNKEELLYIGRSGQKINGKLVHRKTGLGGMKDRLVNGYHPKFGRIHRRISFPQEMIKQNIAEIKVYWWITFIDDCADFPNDTEDKLTRIYRDKYKQLPSWHA